MTNCKMDEGTRDEEQTEWGERVVYKKRIVKRSDVERGTEETQL